MLKHRSLLPLLLVLLFSQCRPGGDFKIPVNKVKASQHVISLDEAERLKGSYQTTKKELQRQLMNNFLDSAFNLPDGEMFNRDAISALLNVKGAMGIRIYLGHDDKGQVRMVLLPTDSAGNDIAAVLVPGERAVNVPGISSAQAQSDKTTAPYQAMESGQRCPPLCSGQLQRQ
jgi:hypothetical protein